MAWHMDGRWFGPAVVVAASLCASGAWAQVTSVAPYYASVQADKAPLRSGAGEHYLFAGQLATVIARREDTGGLLEAAVLSGG